MLNDLKNRILEIITNIRPVDHKQVTRNQTHNLCFNQTSLLRVGGPPHPEHVQPLPHPHALDRDRKNILNLYKGEG